VLRREKRYGGRTGAAVHEQSTLLEELSGHTARMLAISHPVFCVLNHVLGKLLDVLHGGDVWLRVAVKEMCGCESQLRSWMSKEVARSKCPASSTAPESNLALRRTPARVSASPSTLDAPSSFRVLGSATVSTLTSRHCSRKQREDCSHYSSRAVQEPLLTARRIDGSRDNDFARGSCTNARGKGDQVAGSLNSTVARNSSFFLTSLCWDRILSRRNKSLGAL
jgi:hypothetical protein